MTGITEWTLEEIFTEMSKYNRPGQNTPENEAYLRQLIAELERRIGRDDN